MAIYRKNAGAVTRWRKASGKKMYSSLKTVTDSRGVKHGIEEKNGKFYRLRDGKRVAKAAKSKSTDPHKHFLTAENAALFLARMADPSIGKSEVRKGSSFVKAREANIKKGLMGGHKSGGKARATTQKKAGRKAASSADSMHGYDSAMAMKHGEGISLADAWAVFRGEVTLAEVKGSSKPKRATRGKGKKGKRGKARKNPGISFYDLY